MSIFDLKQFLIENKITRNSNLFESDDDFEFTDTDKDLASKLPNEWLNTDSIITPDMWDKQKFETNLLDNLLDNEIYNETIQNSYVIKSIYKNENDWFVILVLEKTDQLWDITGYNTEKLSFLNSLLKDKYTIVGKDMNESDDDFEFTDIDKKLAKGLSSSYIIIELINEYTFSEGGDGITLYEVKTIETDSHELEKILQLDIPYDKNSLETLLKDQYFENDDLMDFLNEGEITQAIPDEYYGDDWDNEWEGFDIKVILS